jgi:hypothetical protein
MVTKTVETQTTKDGGTVVLPQCKVVDDRGMEVTEPINWKPEGTDKYPVLARVGILRRMANGINGISVCERVMVTATGEESIRFAWWAQQPDGRYQYIPQALHDPCHWVQELLELAASNNVFTGTMVARQMQYWAQFGK